MLVGTSKPSVSVELVEVVGDREPFVALLEEADAPEPLRRYLTDGRLFEAVESGVRVGVALLIIDGDDIELRNLAVIAAHRGRGVGGAILERVASLARAEGVGGVTVGTADASLDTIGFYLRSGFRITGVRAGFFDDYPEVVIENGIQARDMVMLRRPVERG